MHLNLSLHYIQKNVFTRPFQDHILCIISGNLFKGTILESFRNKLSYAIDVETINFYSPFQFEVLPYCLIILNLSCISETLDLYSSKHVVELVLQANMNAPIHHMSMLLYRFPFYIVSIPFVMKSIDAFVIKCQKLYARICDMSTNLKFDNLYSN